MFLTLQHDRYIILLCGCDEFAFKNTKKKILQLIQQHTTVPEPWPSMYTAIWLLLICKHNAHSDSAHLYTWPCTVNTPFFHFLSSSFARARFWLRLRTLLREQEISLVRALVVNVWFSTHKLFVWDYCYRAETNWLFTTICTDIFETKLNLVTKWLLKKLKKNKISKTIYWIK